LAEIGILKKDIKEDQMVVSKEQFDKLKTEGKLFDGVNVVER